MADRLQWTDANMSQLYTLLSEVDLPLSEALEMTEELIRDMEADADWSAEHKPAFMAFMDLMRQLHKALADPKVGKAAMQKVSDFRVAWMRYYDSSTLFGSLGEVQ